MTYARMGRLEESLQINRDIYSGRLKLHGKEHGATLLAASNYAAAFGVLRRYEEAKEITRETIPVARRVLGDSDALTIRMKLGYVITLYRDPGATLEDLREAVTTLEDMQRTARRVFGGAHPLTMGIEESWQQARAVHGIEELRPEVPP